jgi:hypothetical protein
MFDRPDDPLYLQARLEAFLECWHGHRKPWFGIALETIKATQLPQPLAWLYGFAGEWQSRNYWDTLLGNQDCLLHFEDLHLRDGKLAFINENQGVWQAGTNLTGDDPPVWATLDDGPWQLIDESLTRFLVTFVLHETVFGCEHLGTADDVIGQLTAAGMYVVPLWLDHPYPAFDDNGAARPISFHIAEFRYLVMDNHWCATNRESPWIALPAIFKEKEARQPTGKFSLYDPLPDHIQLPSIIRRNHLEQAIRRHETAIQYHEARREFFRHLLGELKQHPEA